MLLTLLLYDVFRSIVILSTIKIDEDSIETMKKTAVTTSNGNDSIPGVQCRPRTGTILSVQIVRLYHLLKLLKQIVPFNFQIDFHV